MVKLYLDDIRSVPDGWMLVKTASEAIDILKNYHVSECSLDHDLGPEEAGTGYDVILYLEEQAYLGNKVPNKIKVHSANPVGRNKMEAGIENINKMREGLG